MERLTEVDRRAFLKGAAGTTVVTMGASTAVLAEDNKEYDFDRIDDRGNPIEENVTAESSGSSLGVAAESEGKNPTDPPDATIEASEFEWIELDPDEFENDTYALRLSDDGGVNFNFEYQTEGDLTADIVWRHDSGGELAYLFNDLDSERQGFRAFTNGIAGDGLFFRNPFGGNDIFVDENFQDGEWYQIRVVLDESENTYSVFIDGELMGQEHYDGSGFSTSPTYRIMGRKSGTSTLIDYRYFAWDNVVVLPEEAERVESSILQLDLEEGEGEIIDNDPGSLDELISEKRDTIADIRSLAADTIGEDAAGEEVDTRAEELLDDIEDDAFDATDDQYNEALERMVAAEEVTRAATDTVTGEDSPTRTYIRDLFALTKGAALELVSIVTGGRIRGSVNSLLRSLIRRFESLLDTYGGRGVVPNGLSRDVSNFVDRWLDKHEETFGAFAESEPEKYEDITEAAADVGIDVTERAGSRLNSALNEGEGTFIDELEELFFRDYYFMTSWPQVEIPAPDEISFGDEELEYEIELPEEIEEVFDAYEEAEERLPEFELPEEIEERLPEFELPEEIEDAVEDGAIGVSVSPPSVDVPDELQTLIEVQNELSEARVGGINTTIDEQMESLSTDVLDLDEQDGTTRELVSDGLSTGISLIGETVKALIEALEGLEDLLDDASTWFAYFSVAAVIGAGVALATSVGTATLLGVAGVLAKISAVLGLLSVLVNAPQLALGLGYLTNLPPVHGKGTFALANTRLGGVDL